MKAILSEVGFAFNASDYINLYGNEMLLKLQRKYTIRTVDRTTKIPHVSKMYKMIKGNGFKIIEFPRFVMNELITDQTPSAKRPIVDVQIQLPTVERINLLEYIGKSNPNQKLIVKHVIDTFNNSLAGLTLKAGAGTGKTYSAMDIIGKMKLKTLIVVPNTYMLDQWVNLLKQYFPTAMIGTLYGKQKQDGDIIVGIINTIAELKTYQVSKKKPWPNTGKTLKYMKVIKTIDVDNIFKEVGLTIFDESHMYVSKEFRKVFQRIWSRYTIGLSATPDIREDKLDAIHQAWLGPILDVETLEGYSVSQDSFISDVSMIEYHALNENCQFNIREDGMIEYSSIIEAMITDPHRNNLIIEEVLKLMAKGLYTFVFSDRRTHLEHLYDLLETRCNELNQPSSIELPESDRKVILYGGSDEKTIDKAKTLSSVIFTTYAYSSTGVSITKMNGLVLTTPRRSNMKQIINRVFRLGSDQKIRRIIVDIVDAKFPIKGQVRERIKAYQERGCDIIKSKVVAEINLSN